MDALEELFLSLSKRYRPEDVAELVRRVLGGAMNREELRALNRAAAGAHSRGGFGYSSMADDFHRPIGLATQVATACGLFPSVPPPGPADCDSPAAVRPYVAAAGGTVGMIPGKCDFLADRLNRAGRGAAGLGDVPKRQYNKRFRLIRRMETKIAVLEREIIKREFTLVGKSRLASRIPRDEFFADRDASCFAAYLTARANLRSVFTEGPQDRAYDEIADALFDRCRRNPATNWWVVAHVHPDREVLARLSDDQKGRYLALWFDLLGRIGGLLRTVWEKSRFDRAAMIVRKGDDSTTWNATAGAWNKAREGWIAVLYAMDLEDVLDTVCPGKVLRLMAADVAYWHRATGGGLEPDTAVWAALPAPWDVLDGTAACPKAAVEAACRKHGVDPIAKGWTVPRPDRRVATYRPTPELVHGIAVGHPGLAKILRAAGFWSGKGVKLPADG